MKYWTFSCWSLNRNNVNLYRHFIDFAWELKYYDMVKDCIYLINWKKTHWLLSIRNNSLRQTWWIWRRCVSIPPGIPFVAVYPIVSKTFRSVLLNSAAVDDPPLVFVTSFLICDSLFFVSLDTFLHFFFTSSGVLVTPLTFNWIEKYYYSRNYDVRVFKDIYLNVIMQIQYIIL